MSLCVAAIDSQEVAVIEDDAQIRTADDVSPEVDLGTESHAQKGFVLLVDVPIVPDDATRIDEGAQDQVPIGKAVDALRRDAEVTKRREINDLLLRETPSSWTAWSIAFTFPESFPRNSHPADVDCCSFGRCGGGSDCWVSEGEIQH